MKNSSKITVTDYQELAEFRYQLRRFLRFSEETARRAGIEPHHHQLLLAIMGRPDGEEPRIAYLAERLQIQHHSAVELVDRLVKKGLLKRVRSEKDRREVHVHLTAHGRRVLSALTMDMRAELQSAAPALVTTLQKLTRASKDRPPAHPPAEGTTTVRRAS